MIHMKRLLFLFLITLCVQAASAQLILKERFDYPLGNITDQDAWAPYAAAGSQPVQVVEGGLQFVGYNFTDTDGKALRLNPTAQGTEDVYTRFSETVTTGSLYLSFLVKVDETTPSTNTNPTDFLNLASSTRNTTRGRLAAIEASPDTYKLRLIWGATASQHVETSKTYQYGETYLVVLKYERVSGADNDLISLYTFDSAPPFDEPTSADIAPFGFTGDIDPTYVNLQQLGPAGSPTNTTPQNITIDGMAAGRSWRDIFREGQPVLNFDDLIVEMGSEPIVLNGTVVSGNPITYTIEEGKEDVATLSDNVLTIVGMGTARITATASGTDDYMDAEKRVLLRVVASYGWLHAPAITVEGNSFRVVGPGADRFTKFYVNEIESTDLTDLTEDIHLRATTADGREIIRLKINR